MDPKKLLIGWLVLLAAAAAPLPAPAAPPTSRPAVALEGSFELPDVDGAPRRPLANARIGGAKAVVFLFVGTDCPISNAYAPEINRICSQYGKPAGGTDKTSDSKSAKKVSPASPPSGAWVDFYLVHADADLSPVDAKKHASDFGYVAPVLLDVKKELAGKLGAKVTPQVYVISADGQVLYEGRIDDRYADFGKLRAEPTTLDLRDALDSVVWGKPVRAAATKPIGCPI